MLSQLNVSQDLGNRYRKQLRVRVLGLFTCVHSCGQAARIDGFVFIENFIQHTFFQQKGNIQEQLSYAAATLRIFKLETIKLRCDSAGHHRTALIFFSSRQNQCSQFFLKRKNIVTEKKSSSSMVHQERKVKKKKKPTHKKYEHLAPSVPNNKGVFLFNFTRSYF